MINNLKKSTIMFIIGHYFLKFFNPLQIKVFMFFFVHYETKMLDFYSKSSIIYKREK